MKYKRRITSGALALTLFVGGSSAYAASTQGIGAVGLASATAGTHIPSGIRGGHRGLHDGAMGLGLNHNKVIGEVVAITSTGFTLEVHGPRSHKGARDASSTPPVMVPFDIKTSAATVYQKDGATTTAAALAVGQKVIAVGTIDPASQIVTATRVNIITKLPERPVRGPKVPK